MDLTSARQACDSCRRTEPPLPASAAEQIESSACFEERESLLCEAILALHAAAALSRTLALGVLTVAVWAEPATVVAAAGGAAV